VRVGGLAVVAGIAVCLLVLRAWSIQVLHGPAYKSLATQQAFRTVDMIGPRGGIVDDKGRLLANTTGHVVVAVDTNALGVFDTHGWHASAHGLAVLRRFSSLVHAPVKTMIVKIQRSAIRSLT